MVVKLLLNLLVGVDVVLLTAARRFVSSCWCVVVTLLLLSITELEVLVVSIAQLSHVHYSTVGTS